MKSNGVPITSFARRGFLKSVLAAGAASLVVPGHVLGLDRKPSPNDKLTLGVIGVGAQGQYDLGAFLNFADVRVTAICDVNERNLAAAKQKIATTYGRDEVKVYRDFRQFNADRSMDAVLMALPVHWHSIPSADAILHGKHIYHEKPMAMSFEEAKRVRAAVHKEGVVFQFGTQQRSEAGFRRACALALSGRLGKLKEIQVSVPAGKTGPTYPAQPVPEYVNWDRWVGPAPWTDFHEEKLQRDNHENLSNFSLGMVSCWGIHHLDIAQWGNGCDATGPVSVEGQGEFPKSGSLDNILHWRVHYEYAKAAPVVFVSDGTPGFEHGIRFVGESAWIHVHRGGFKASNEKFDEDPQNQEKNLPVQLPVSGNHPRNFVDAIRSGKRAICDIDAAVRGDTLCQLALIAVKRGGKLQWDPVKERFVKDSAANKMLQPRKFRGDWELPRV